MSHATHKEPVRILTDKQAVQLAKKASKASVSHSVKGMAARSGKVVISHGRATIERDES